MDIASCSLRQRHENVRPNYVKGSNPIIISLITQAENKSSQNANFFFPKANAIMPGMKTSAEIMS
jgi:hypothetical protein